MSEPIFESWESKQLEIYKAKLEGARDVIFHIPVLVFELDAFFGWLYIALQQYDSSFCFKALERATCTFRNLETTLRRLSDYIP